MTDKIKQLKWWALRILVLAGIFGILPFEPFSSNAAFSNHFTEACGRAFKQISQEVRRLDNRVNERVVFQPSRWKGYRLVERKALTHFVSYKANARLEAGTLHSYEFRSLFENAVKGYNVVIEVEKGQNEISYFFDSRGRMLYWFWYSQNPMSQWVCEFYKAPSALQ